MSMASWHLTRTPKYKCILIRAPRFATCKKDEARARVEVKARAKTKVKKEAGLRREMVKARTGTVVLCRSMGRGWLLLFLGDVCILIISALPLSSSSSWISRRQVIEVRVTLRGSLEVFGSGPIGTLSCDHSSHWRSFSPL